ncbi:cobalt-precorrin-5B (C(1))-methyltransferase CbiD [Microcoleus sp. FACHB-672]|uniref:cobalt-precorrin-5B (C(1))-methyltransferase CbiD n=1 Tax=Microcoleus sp. FACHB-672 TaxID=2692825 RepID=UPI00168558F3|nr:cobalt-precorrin-5B (C(1))-methyltransferase CbiD [Microcoleus sp. FACHB-672]MBD2039378.1 cobalt-precorrin-5B (C(1))-methyltransferase [Microcoleus sp. FACHB-672]
MNLSKPRSGYTLPVFACAAALAALHRLKNALQPIPSVSVDLIEPAETVEISIEQVAGIKEGMALAITRSDPGDNLDLTRNTPIWAMVEFQNRQNSSQQNLSDSESQITIQGGEGIGRQMNANEQPAIYAYARRLLQENLSRHLQAEEKITVTIILPEGRQLATRTSNEAFGVIEGLSLLGTSAISQPLSAPGQLDAYCEELRQKAGNFNELVLCVGENGLDLAKNLGVNPEQLVKTANWLGPILAVAGTVGLQSLLLFGYHGKLIKLAGGIFHTHHHLADGRLEILCAHCGNLGLPAQDLQAIFKCATAEDALQYLRTLDQAAGTDWVSLVYRAIAQKIDQRSQNYIRNHTEAGVLVGSVMFDRKRQIIVKSDLGASLLAKFC